MKKLIITTIAAMLILSAGCGGSTTSGLTDESTCRDFIHADFADREAYLASSRWRDVENFCQDALIHGVAFLSAGDAYGNVSMDAEIGSIP